MKLNSLKAKLMLLLILIVFASNGILGFMAYSMSKEGLEESVEKTVTSVAEKVAAQIEQTNEREFHMLDVLANMSVIQAPGISIEEKTAIVFGATKTDAHYENIAFYDETGTGITGDGVKINFSDREYFKKAMAGEHFVSDPMISPVNNKLLMFYSVPVYNPSRSKVIGVICAVFHGETLSDLCKEIYVGKDSHPFVINMKSGKTVADSDVKYVEKGQVLKESTSGEMKEAIIDAMAGNTTYKSFYEPWRKKIMVASYRPVGESCDWAVFCMAPYSEYFGAITKMSVSMLVVLGIVLAIATILSAVIISISLKPLKSVEVSITDIASGNADLTKRITVTSNDEIGNVVKGFNKFTEKLQDIIRCALQMTANVR